MENTVGAFGTAQPTNLRGPRFRNMDIGLLKDKKIREQIGLQFRFEGFNILNHANFNNPVGTAVRLTACNCKEW